MNITSFFSSYLRSLGPIDIAFSYLQRRFYVSSIQCFVRSMIMDIRTDTLLPRFLEVWLVVKSTNVNVIPSRNYYVPCFVPLTLPRSSSSLLLPRLRTSNVVSTFRRNSIYFQIHNIDVREGTLQSRFLQVWVVVKLTLLKEKPP